MTRQTTQVSMSADKRASRSWCVLAETAPCALVKQGFGYESLIGNPADHGSGPSKMT